MLIFLIVIGLGIIWNQTVIAEQEQNRIQEQRDREALPDWVD
jgi:hypothetical protein